MAVFRGLLQRDLQKAFLGLRNMSSEAGLASYNYATLKVTAPGDHIFHVELNRPEKRNAMNKDFWREMVLCFRALSDDCNCRVVVVSGAGKMFTSGIDLMDLAGDFLQHEEDDAARIAWNVRKKIKDYQESFSVIEKVGVNGALFLYGIHSIDLMDLAGEFLQHEEDDVARIAWNVRKKIKDYQESFSVIEKNSPCLLQEVDVGLAADVGTLQRLPSVIGSRSLASELAFTARKMMSDEALSSGFVSRVFPDKSSLLSACFDLASEIASKSPVAVQGTKVNLVYARDHSVQESLDYMATWNMSMLQTEDIMKSAQAALQKKNPKDVTFSKL
ncbi:delta(3,5)-Delta(2,4)-dienoyl-CoA isomerase, mitochondrial [Pyxicephalus adspersus]|uniref:delta(3,5)-Delta(2,4)-dienoyl-CoA isomerase, mitochondrial n=1 Tax=Pyxicephalus adspersus TaxID=30357 RepID=UPI003B59C5FE